MKKPTVYLETSFINYLADPLRPHPKTRQRQLSSRAWWKTLRHNYTLITSTLTLEKSCLKYKNKRIARLRLRYFAPIIMVRCPPIPRDKLADALRQPSGPIPADEINDSIHIANAAISGCECLLTWTHSHIANLDTLPIIRTIIEAHGYHTPKIGNPDLFRHSLR